MVAISLSNSDTHWCSYTPGKAPIRNLICVQQKQLHPLFAPLATWVAPQALPPLMLSAFAHAVQGGLRRSPSNCDHRACLCLPTALILPCKWTWQALSNCAQTNCAHFCCTTELPEAQCVGCNTRAFNHRITCLLLSAYMAGSHRLCSPVQAVYST
jgi:hypothetical protein